MKLRQESGMSLIEVMISLAIFAIGALGVLGMFTTTLYQNMDSRQSQEATVIGNWALEQMQVLPLTDVRLGGPLTGGTCGQAAPCYADGASGQLESATSTTNTNRISISEIQGAAASGARYTLQWIREPNVPATGMAHFRVRVYWPRDRRYRMLESPTTNFVNCISTPTLCRRIEFNTYR